MADRPILIVPGLPGSVLVRADTKQEVWPQATAAGLTPDLNALLDPGIALEAPDVIETVSVLYLPLLTVYKALRDLYAQAGVPYGGTDYAEADARLFIFPYDWRLDLRGTAPGLAQALRDLRLSHGDLWPDLICHSTGGLLARYCLQSNEPALRDVSARRIVFVGTPHRGTTKALLAMDGQVDDYPGIPPARVRDLARNRAFVALRQLLPQPGVPMVWADPGPSGLVNLYDPAIWENVLGQPAGTQAEVTAFADGLSRRTLKDAGVELALCIVGGAYPTVTHVILRNAPANAHWFEAVIPGDSGDGTVPSGSALLEGCPSLNVMSEHFLLFRDPVAEAAILRFLDPALPLPPETSDPPPDSPPGP